MTQSVALVISTSRQLWLNISILKTNKYNMPGKIGKILRIFHKVDNAKGYRVPCQFNLIGVNTLDSPQNYLVSDTAIMGQVWLNIWYIQPFGISKTNNLNIPRKLAKILRIFEKVDHPNRYVA